MKKKLFYMSLSEDNTMNYVVINNSLELEKYDYHQMIELIQSNIISNAKLENGVVKVVDNNNSAINKIRHNEANVDKFYYIISNYNSPATGTNIIILISNTGAIFEMSENAIIQTFKNQNTLINAKIIKTETSYILKINKQISHKTPLQQPINYSHNSHH